MVNGSSGHFGGPVGDFSGSHLFYGGNVCQLSLGRVNVPLIFYKTIDYLGAVGHFDLPGNTSDGTNNAARGNVIIGAIDVYNARRLAHLK